MSHSVLFVGDINVDIIMAGLEAVPGLDREIRCTTFDVAMGSSAVISACSYAALGGKSVFLGLVGTDEYGEFMLRGLHEFGVDTHLVRVTSSIRTGVTVNLVYGRTRTQVTYPGTIAEFDGTGLSGEIFDGVCHAHFAGIYQQTKFQPHLTRLLIAAREKGTSTSLDPQWDASEKWEGMTEWLPLLTYVFVNEDEACSITGVTNVEEATLELGLRTNCPVVKAGQRGAYVFMENRAVRVPTYKAQVVDTTGAGDCFNAGFLFARLVEGMDLVGSVAFANATAARSCEFLGGVAARSTREDVLEVMKREYESA